MPKSRPDSFEALASTSLFKTLPEAALGEVVDACQTLNLKRGQRLFDRGDIGKSLYVIAKGSVEISITGSDGRKITLNIMEPGSCFGEMGMLDGEPRSADASALTASTAALMAPAEVPVIMGKGFSSGWPRISETALRTPT